MLLCCWQGEDSSCSSNCIPFFYSGDIQALCRGDSSLRPPEKDVDTK